MKKTVFLKIFASLLTLGLIFSSLSVVSFAVEEEICISVGEGVLYRGAAPDADSFETVYYKNGGAIGSEADYNAKLDYDAEGGFTLTLNGLDVRNPDGEYSIFSTTDLNIVVLSDSKIVHTVNENTKNRYAIYVDGKLTVSGDGAFDVFLRGNCDFSALGSHAVRAHNTSGLDKINACDGRSEQEKQIDNIRAEFENQINKTNYELALAKLNFANTAERLGFETQRAKNIAIAAVVIGSVSLLANGVIAVLLVVKRKNSNEDFDDEE